MFLFEGTLSAKLTFGHIGERSELDDGVQLDFTLLFF